MPHPELSRRQFLAVTGTAVAAGGWQGIALGSPASKQADAVKRLTDWVVNAVVGDGIELVANLPAGATRGGRSREDLARLCWLQNCNLFAFHALRDFHPATARRIEESYRRWYAKSFPNIEERTENYLTVGQLPARNPPPGKYYRTVVQQVKQGEYTIGTETIRPDWMGSIVDDDPRSLLKFGALGCQLRNEKVQAQRYLQKALALWDGAGFRTPRRERHDAYYTRYLAYALIVEKALQVRLPQDVREGIQARLWSVQDRDGGLWTNYHRDGTIPPFGKKTTEIGPLTLLAYADSVWP